MAIRWDVTRNVKTDEQKQNYTNVISFDISLFLMKYSYLKAKK